MSPIFYHGKARPEILFASSENKRLQTVMNTYKCRPPSHDLDGFVDLIEVKYV